MPGRTPWDRLPGLAFPAAAVAVSALVGIAPAVLSTTATIVLGAAAGVLLLAVATYRYLGGRSRVSAQAQGAVSETALPPEDADEAVDPFGIRLGRLLFFAGVLTVAQDSWQAGFGLTISEAAFVAAFALCCVSVLAGSASSRLPGLLVAGVGIFAAGGLISSLSAAHGVDSALSVIRAVYVMLLWGWTATMVLARRRDVVTGLTLWAISVAFNGVVAIGDIAGLVETKATGSRSVGLATHPNELGGAAAVVLVPALMLAIRRSGGGLAALIARGAVAVLVVAALVLSGSVAAMAGGILAVTIWLSAPAIRGVGRVAVAIAVLAAFAAASVAGGVTPPGERLAEVTSAPGTSQAAGSGSYRLAILEVAWPRIAADPFVGEGLANDDRAVEFISGSESYVAHIHGAPIAAWYEGGIFGLLGLIVVFAGLVHAGWRASSSAPDADAQLLGWSIVGAFSAFAVVASSGPLYFQGYGWLAAAMLLAWWARTVPEAARGRSAEPASAGSAIATVSARGSHPRTNPA